MLIIGGSKSGNPKFYERITAKAEEIWERYLKDLAAGQIEEN